MEQKASHISFLKKRHLIYFFPPSILPSFVSVPTFFSILSTQLNFVFFFLSFNDVKKNVIQPNYVTLPLYFVFCAKYKKKERETQW
jgi:hypothetical protein